MRVNRQKEAALTAANLRGRVFYDPATGVMTWRRHRRSTNVGREIGYLKDGYRIARLDDGSFQVHRLAWLYVYGDWPEETIDHINCVRDDNRIANLRAATPLQNMANRPATGGRRLKGITRVGERWIAQIKLHGKNIRIGAFDTPEEAHAAYAERAVHLHGEFAYASA